MYVHTYSITKPLAGAHPLGCGRPNDTDRIFALIPSRARRIGCSGSGGVQRRLWVGIWADGSKTMDDSQSKGTGNFCTTARGPTSLPRRGQRTSPSCSVRPSDENFAPVLG